MKQLATRLWRKPWGKALFAALYSLATIIVYLVVAQVLYGAFRTTIVPDIGHDRSQAVATDPAEMKRLTTYTPYTGPGSPYPQAPAAPQPTTEEIQRTLHASDWTAPGQPGYQPPPAAVNATPAVNAPPSDHTAPPQYGGLEPPPLPASR